MPKAKPLEVQNPYGVLRDWSTDEEIGPATRNHWEAYRQASARFSEWLTVKDSEHGMIRDWITDRLIEPASLSEWEAYAEASAMVPNGAIKIGNRLCWIDRDTSNPDDNEIPIGSIKVDGRLCYVHGGPCHPVRPRTWNGPEWNQSDDGGPYDPQAYQPPHGGIC